MEYSVTCVVGIELASARRATSGAARSDIERHVSDAMRELEHRWVSDSSVEVDFTRCEAAFLLLVEAGDQQRAMSKAWGVLSMAVHAAGGATSHRPFPPDAEWSVRLLTAKALPREKEDRTAAFA